MKKKEKFLDGILYYSFGFVSLYTVFVTLVWAVKGQEPPPVLTEWVYRFWGFEVFMTALITIFKIIWKQKGSDMYGS